MKRARADAGTLTQLEARVALAQNALTRDLGTWRHFWRRREPELVVGGGLASGLLIGLLNERLPLRMAASAIGAMGFRIVSFAASNVVAAVKAARVSNSNNNPQANH